jgi:hypothetical protein
MSIIDEIAKAAGDAIEDSTNDYDVARAVAKVIAARLRLDHGQIEGDALRVGKCGRCALIAELEGTK